MKREEMMRELVETVTHPQFDKLVREIEQQPKESRLIYAQKFATVPELKKRGVPLNDQFRVCIRMFEDKKSPTSTYDQIFQVEAQSQDKEEPIEGGWTICASLGYVLCITVGYTQ